MVASSRQSVELQGRLFPRRIDRLAWPGGKLSITVCPASRQVILQQGGVEIAIPVHRWPEVEESAARLVLPKSKG